MKYKIISKDRLLAGGIAGMVGAVTNGAYGMAVKALKITDITFIDYSAIILSRKLYPGILGFTVAFLAHMAFGLILGAVFVYIIKSTSSRYYLLKGLAYGFVLWFLLQGLGTICHLPKFTYTPPNVALTTMVGSIIFGLVTAYTLSFIEHKTNLL